MQVGSKIPPSQEILNLGFKFVNSIKILGMEIDSDIENLDSNFSSIHDSIKKTAGYWSRYNLTIPGRINVAKSLLVSLINYLGCFVMPKTGTLNSIQKTIDDFIIGKNKVARNRLYLPVEDGGLGCFKLDDFLTAQQCVWIIKAHQSQRDNWRVNVLISSSGNCLNFSWRQVEENLHPILHGLGKSFEKLRVNHDSANENFLHAFVLFNPMVFRGPGNKLPLDTDFLGATGNFNLCRKLSTLTIGDCYGQFGLLTSAELRIIHDIELSLEGYANLGRAVNHFTNRLTVRRLNDGTSASLENNLQLKKPGVKIRGMLTKRRKKHLILRHCLPAKRFLISLG
jgi:hypothetical protein